MATPDAPLPWIAESETFCAGDRKALLVWGDQLVASTREALERSGAPAEQLNDSGFIAWLAVDTLIGGLKLDRVDTSALAARVVLKAALSLATDAANTHGSVVSPSRAARALAGLQLTASHGLRLALEGGQAIGARH